MTKETPEDKDGCSVVVSPGCAMVIIAVLVFVWVMS